MVARSRLRRYCFEDATKLSMILQSIITCPKCGVAKMETMPTEACQYFYECTGCGAKLKPERGDCCVFYSYGSVACPPSRRMAPLDAVLGKHTSDNARGAGILHQARQHPERRSHVQLLAPTEDTMDEHRVVRPGTLPARRAKSTRGIRRPQEHCESHTLIWQPLPISVRMRGLTGTGRKNNYARRAA